MQFCCLARHADVVDASCKTGLHAPGADQLQERGFGVGVGHDQAAADAFAAPGFNSDRPLPLQQDSPDRRCRPDFRAGCFRGVVQRVGNRSHSSRRQRDSAAAAVQLSREPVQPGQHRTGRARAQVGAQHGVQAQRALQPLVGKGFLQHVMDVDCAGAQQFPHRLPAQQAQLQAQPGQGRQFRRAVMGQARRARHERLLQQAGKTPEFFHEQGIGGAVGLGQSGAVHGIPPQGEVVAVRRERDGV